MLANKICGVFPVQLNGVDRTAANRTICKTASFDRQLATNFAHIC